MKAAALYRPPALAIPERQLPFFKALYTTLDNPMEGWPRAVYEQPIYQPPRRDFRTLYVCDPAALKTVLLDEVADFPKSPFSQRLLSPMLGQGLLTAELKHWRWQRRAAAPAFQDQRCEREAPIIANVAADWLARRRASASPLDITEEMMAITFDIILETMLGGRKSADAQAMSCHFTTYLRHLGRPSLADLLDAPAWVRAKFSPEGARAIAFMHEAVDQMIAERRAAPARNDLVDLLLNARDGQTGRAMSDREVRDNLLTFLAAGHETTALALTWSLYLISQHRETETRILDEIEDNAGEAPIDAAIASRLVFTRQVIQEALRLYPPIPVLTRVAARSGELSGHNVAKGDIIVVPIYALHRHDLYWREPHCFDPDRFEPGAGLDRRRFVYMPFGAGPRVCIGTGFAMTEAVIVLASLLREVSFRALPGHRIRPLLRITMRPEGGLPMQLTLRQRGLRQKRASGVV